MSPNETGSDKPIDFQDCTILIIDDEPANLGVIVDTMTRHGFRTAIARTGGTGVEMALRNIPDLILLDINLPDIDGYEVCRRLKEDRKTRDIPVIFLSVMNGVLDRIKGFELGAIDYIAKPFQHQEALARITTHLRVRALTEKLEETVQHRTAELKKANERLRQSEQRYALAQRAGNIGSWDWNIATGELQWSEIIEPMFGFAEGKFDGTYKAFLQCVHPADRKAVSDATKASIEQNQDYAIEHRIVRPDGTVRWVAETGDVYRDEQGRAIRMLGIVQDITKRKRTEEELRQHKNHLEDLVKARTDELVIAKEQADAARNAAEDANRAKSDFLARMSHEIRTPLNAVTGLTNVVLKSELTDEQRGYLNKVQIAANNLLDVINDILDFSKVESGLFELAHNPFDLDQLLEQLADIFSARTAQKDLELIFGVSPEVSRQLSGDAARLTQILTNLIENAIKFTETGEIVIGVEPAGEAEDPGNQTTLKFTVRDTGTGIAAELLPTLFDPFIQADSSLTRSHEGTGLGLAICRRLVDMMGGRIWVESSLGQGSTFTFTAVFEARAQQKPPIRMPTKLHGLKSLVVDDSATARQVLYDLLESFHFNVSAVDSGEKALETLHRASAEPYQLVLLDWKMPGLDGIETAHRIRESEFRVTETDSPLRQPAGHEPIAARLTPSPPIIILVTAYGQTLLQERINTAVADSVLLKPVKASELFNTINELFNQKTAKLPEVTKKSAAPDLRLPGRRILVVEDSELNRDVAVALLEETGLTVETAENGKIAEAKVTNSPKGTYDAVLMDIQMPVMDGYEATRRIREWERRTQDYRPEAENPAASSSAVPGLFRLPVIALTAHALKGEKEKCLAAGMDDYLAKPLDEKELHQVLLNWIAKTRGPG